MKKLLILLLAVVCVMCMLVACGGEEEPTKEPVVTPTEPTETEAPTTAPTEDNKTETPTNPPECEHTTKVVLGKKATCTEKGLTDGKSCITCGEILVKQEEIPALGHKWVDATCTAPKTCETCKETEGKALGHTEKTPATCSSPAICSVCNEAYGKKDTENGHNWGALVNTDANKHWSVCSICNTKDNEAAHTYKDGVCTDCGYGCDHIGGNATCADKAKCSLCKCPYGETLPHTWTDATCTAPKTCSECDATEGEALGHSEGTAATCTSPAVCSVCSEEYGTIVANAHNWVDADCTLPKRCTLCKVTEGDALGHKEIISVQAIEPTCTENGRTQGTKCERCDSTLVLSQKINALGHDPDANNVCNTCGLLHGSEAWMYDLVSGTITTPAYTNDVSTWYYSYRSDNTQIISVNANGGATVSITVNGIAVNGTDINVEYRDDVVVAITKPEGSNAAVSFSVSIRKEIPIVENISNSSNYLPTATMVATNAVFETQDGVSYIKMTTTSNGDPYFYFNIRKYQTNVLQVASRYTLNARDYQYLLLKVKAPDCSGGTLSVYAVDSSSNHVYKAGSEFIPGSNDWHYVFIDLNDVDFSIEQLRFDLDSATAAENTVLISSITAFATYKEALEYVGVDVTPTEKPTLTPEQEAEKDQLISGTTDHDGYDNYTPETAENEDAQINLWFNHTYTRTPETTVTPGTMFSYKLLLARNEIEGCQLILSSEAQKNGLTIEVSNFAHKNGIDTMESEILMGYYFDVDEDGDGIEESIIDPLPPVQGNFSTFDLNNSSQTFVVKAKSKADTAAGEYSATVIVKDADGNEIKKVTVFAYVWNIVLPEATSCKTLMDLDNYNLLTMYKDWSGEYNLYENYYNFLLENRICAYDVPGLPNCEGNYANNSSVMAYLENPRVVAFINLGWSVNKQTYKISEQLVQNSYNALTNSDGSYKLDAAGTPIVDKGYFYPVDEPSNQDRLNAIKAKAELVQRIYGDNYNILAPIHTTGHIVNSDGSVDDFFSYLKDHVTAWCPKTFFFNTLNEVVSNPNATQGTSIYAEQNFGLFKDRMEAEQTGGDEVWWYVTRRPNDPETTLIINTEATRYRLLFWQQKLYNVDGFLYYLCNDWRPASDGAGIDNAEALNKEFNDTQAWYSKNEVSSISGYNVYGNGVLIYPGVRVADDYYNAVGSLRLECVRDGIEDFEYLTMLEDIIGKDKVDMIINEMATSLTDYKTDAELMYELREAVGTLLEAELAK